LKELITISEIKGRVDEVTDWISEVEGRITKEEVLEIILDLYVVEEECTVFTFVTRVVRSKLDVWL
jgi:hypothetical protein